MYPPNLKLCGTIDFYVSWMEVFPLSILNGGCQHIGTPTLADYKALYEEFLEQNLSKTFILRLNEDRYNVINSTNQ
jgi:hypothetical protein